MDSEVFYCSIQRDYTVPYNIVNYEYYHNSTCVANSNEPKAMGLGTVTGIFIAMFVEVLLAFQCHEHCGAIKNALYETFNGKTMLRLLILIILVLTLPIVALFLILALVYKVLCLVVIKQKDKYFVSFLDSFDVFWSLENDTSQSVINVLGVIEADSPQAVAINIKKELQKVLPNDNTRKIFYRRSEEYGFYYWRKFSSVDMDQYVDIVEFETESGSNSERDLENFMTKLQDQSLPYEDEGLFKILITRQRIGKHENARGEYGIVFRIHHSVGDGVALIEFLCQTLADKDENSSVNMFSLPEPNNHNSTASLIDMIRKLWEIPLCLVDGIIRKPDENALHGPILNGKKIFKWTDSDENLLTMVKDIKENVRQFNFSDVLLSSLSSGLRDFLSEKTTPIPEDIAVILPVRFPESKTSSDPILKNDFSVTILDVPIKNEADLNEIKHRCNKLRRSADPLANYYMLKLLCGVLPKSVLGPLLTSRQATMIFSNMPGPKQMTLCGGNVLKSLVFFVPYKGTTGLGVTALCYGGVLRFAAMADGALVSGPEELARILHGMVERIRQMHRQVVQ